MQLGLDMIGHGVEQVLVAGHFVVADAGGRHLFEEPAAAVDLGVLYRVELHRLQRALRLPAVFEKRFV